MLQAKGTAHSFKVDVTQLLIPALPPIELHLDDDGTFVGWEEDDSVGLAQTSVVHANEPGLYLHRQLMVLAQATEDALVIADALGCHATAARSYSWRWRRAVMQAPVTPHPGLLAAEAGAFPA